MGRHAEVRSARAERRSRIAAAAVCLGLSAVAVSAASPVLAEVRSGASAAASAPAAADGSAGATAASTVSAAVVPAPAAVALSDAAAPVAVRVPSLDVESPLVHLGVAADGTLEVPQDAAVAGWFAPGTAPGAVGPAVVAGHVDSARGPGVFADLAGVEVGASVEVDREDGSTVAFVVTRVQQVAKDAFPTEDVYGPVAGPELRLITCGGAFDAATGHYVDNVVVFAQLA